MVLPSNFLELSDRIIKSEYLNYLKWTENIIEFLTTLEDEQQALRIVSLGLEIDLQLGAKLAGSVKPKFQEKATRLLLEKDIPEQLKVFFNQILKSQTIIPTLFEISDNLENAKFLKILADKDPIIRKRANAILANQPLDIKIPALTKALHHRESRVCWIAAKALSKIQSKLAIPSLIEALNNKNANARFVAIIALGDLQVLDMIPTFLEMTKDKNPSIRWAAVLSLAKLQANSAIPRIVEMLKDKDYNVRCKAVEALETLKATPNLRALILDKDPIIQRQVLQSLNKLGCSLPISALLKILEGNDWIAVSRASGALRREKSPEIFSELFKMLNHDKEEVRDRAVDILEKLDKEEYFTEIVEFVKSQNLETRRYGIRLISSMQTEKKAPILFDHLLDIDNIVRLISEYGLKDIESKSLISELLEVLNKFEIYSYSVVEYAIKELGDLKIKEAIPYLLRIINSNRSRKIDAIKALGKIELDLGISEINKLLENDDEVLRANALDMIVDLDVKASIPLLLQGLKDKHGMVKRLAAIGLGKLKVNTAIPVLLELLRDEKDSWTWYTFADSLIKIDTKSCLPELLRTIEENNDNQEIYRNAVFLLSKLMESSTIPFLIKALNKDDFHILISASYALGELKAKEAISGLINLLSHKMPYVNEKAKDALIKICCALIQNGETSQIGVMYEKLSQLIKLGSPTACETLEQIQKSYGVYNCTDANITNG